VFVYQGQAVKGIRTAFGWQEERGIEDLRGDQLAPGGVDATTAMHIIVINRRTCGSLTTLWRRSISCRQPTDLVPTFLTP
jgi:hypothetical protein